MKRLVALLLFVVLLVAGAGTAGASAIFGEFPGTTRCSCTEQSALAARESAQGFHDSAHRIFQTPQSTFTLTGTVSPQTGTLGKLADDRAHNRWSYLSVHIPTGYTWDTFAANGGSQMVSFAQLLNAQGGNVVLTLEHEPDVTAHQNGTSAGYRALVQAVFFNLRAYAPNVKTLIVFAGYKVATGTQTMQDLLDNYFPTGHYDLVDILGQDPYDAAYPGGVSKTFQTLAAPFLFTAAGIGKFLSFLEVGVDYNVTDRATWMTAAVNYVKTDARMNAFMWFDADTNAPDPTHNFWLDGDGSNTTGNAPVFTSTWVSLMGNSYFTKGT